MPMFKVIPIGVVVLSVSTLLMSMTPWRQTGKQPPPGYPHRTPGGRPHSLTRPQTTEDCPHPKTITTFDKEKYLGNWYEAARLPVFFEPPGTRCVYATYGANADGTLSARNMAVSPEGEFHEICGYVTSLNMSAPGSLTVQFPKRKPGSYNILGTDYKNYAVVYTCSVSPSRGKLEFGWILTRSRTPSKKVIDEARNVISSNGISLDKFEDTYQGDNCIYEQKDKSVCVHQNNK